VEKGRGNFKKKEIHRKSTDLSTTNVLDL